MTTFETLINKKLLTINKCGFSQLVKQKQKFCLIPNLTNLDNWSQRKQKNAKHCQNDNSAKLNVIFFSNWNIWNCNNTRVGQIWVEIWWWIFSMANVVLNSKISVIFFENDSLWWFRLIFQSGRQIFQIYDIFVFPSIYLVILKFEIFFITIQHIMFWTLITNFRIV